MSRVRVGTSGWSDPGYSANWFPKNLQSRDRLAWYARYFDLVEVNSTFYSLPQTRFAERWVMQTPDDFIFDVKLFRMLSRHTTDPSALPRDLRESATVRGKRVIPTKMLEEELVHRFLKGIEPIIKAKKLGALLLQFSPGFAPRMHDLTELDPLLTMLRPHTVAVELRHRDWVDPAHFNATMGYFTSRHVTFVMVDAPASSHFTVMPDITAVTNPHLGYLRAHGRNAEGYIMGKSVEERFFYDYTPHDIREIVARVSVAADATEETHVLFNNNTGDFAPRAGMLFRDLYEEMTAKPVSRPVEETLLTMEPY